MIRRCVNEALNELDWKTYANAAKKRYEQSREPSNSDKRWDLYNKSYKLNQMANQRFDDDYVGNMKYDTMGDKFKGKHSPRFSSHFDVNKTDRMPYGAVTGYNKGGDEVFSTEKGKYHSGKSGRVKPSSFFRDKEVGTAFERANDELWDYDKGNYEYIKGKGWQLKNKPDENK